MRFTAGGIIFAIMYSAVALAQVPQPPPGGPPGGPPIGVRHPFAPPAPIPPPNQPQATPPGDGERINTVIDRKAPLDAQIDQSIDLGVKYLLSHQRDDGSWTEGMDPSEDVGRTSLVGLALLSCGVSHQSPEMVKTINYLKHAKPDGMRATYSTALRAAFFSQLPESQRKQELMADVQWLQQAMFKRGPGAGMYTYFKPANDFGIGDFSNTQYGVLGTWYAALAGLEINSGYWKQVEDCWRAGQVADGGWGYTMQDGDSYASMTAAGVATLFITYDYLHSREEVDLRRLHSNPPLERGIAWLGSHFAVDFNSGRDAPSPEQQPGDMLSNVFGAQPHVRTIGTWVHYMLFGYERVGEASGLTRFGTHKWFDEGARFLTDVQNQSGSWTGSLGYTVDTSYALLFLSRGRSPVALQKLQFKGRWDNRSRDAASIVRWLTHETERHTNWQIVPVEASPAEMREAPILYVASDKPIVLRDTDKQRIKTYIDQGGMLLAVNEGTTQEFGTSIVQLAKELYPAYEFRNLPPDHVIYGENFPVKGLLTNPRALSNGVRELIVLFPTGDMTWKYQQGAGTSNPALAPPFSFFGDLYLYMNDKANPRYKGQDTWIDANPAAQDSHDITVARLKINANWNPEPLGWTRLANMLHNGDATKLNLPQIDLNITPLTDQMPLATLTTTNSFELNPVEQDQLKHYLDAGGVILFDAAGGSTTAQISVETLLLRMYPTAKLETLPIDHPIYTGESTGGLKIEQVTYRRYATDRLPRTTLPRLRVAQVNGKIVAIDSAEDLSAGLVGYNIDGIVGYSPASCAQLVRNIVLWAASGKPGSVSGK